MGALLKKQGIDITFWKDITLRKVSSIEKKAHLLIPLMHVGAFFTMS